MLIIVLLSVQLSIGVFSQGVFDPPSFTQSKCSDKNQWTIWFDLSDPNKAQGEFEITNHIQQKFPLLMCPAPIAIEVNRNFVLVKVRQ